MKSRDMTQGTIWKQLVFFALPLCLANMLQQSYNAFDAIIVGRFVSSQALAAVGASGPLINVITMFFQGMSNGSSVLIAQYFGAKNAAEIKKTVHTAMLLAFLIGVVLSIIGIIVTPILLRAIKTPDEVFVEAVTYLRIYFAGISGLTIYNMGAAILTATGDSKRPLYFLAFSMVIKIALTFLFVLVYDMGIKAVAFSTVISQVINAVLIIVLLSRQSSEIRLDLRQLRLHKDILKSILNIGLPGGLQGAIVSFSNVFIQAYINLLGGSAMAGYGVVNRIDGIFMNGPQQSLAMASSTFVGQNLGARQVSRAKSGMKVALLTGFTVSVTMALSVLFNSNFLMHIFTTDEEVISQGLQFMRVFVPLHFTIGFAQIMTGALRGSGDVRIPTLLNVMCMVVFRQIYLFFATRLLPLTITTVAFCMPIGWILFAISIFTYYRKKGDWSRFEPEEEVAASSV